MWSTSNKLLRWRIIQTKTTFFSRNPVIVEVAEFARLWGNWSGGLVSRGAAHAILPIRKITLGLLGTCCRFHPNKIKQIRDIVIVVLYGETKQSIRGSGKRDYRQLSACNGIPAYDRSSLIFCSLLVLISAATGSAKDRDRSWDIRGGRRLSGEVSRRRLHSSGEVGSRRDGSYGVPRNNVEVFLYLPCA
jgi:hypothetical protein